MEDRYIQWALAAASVPSSDDASEDVNACFDRPQTLPSFETFRSDTMDTYDKTKLSTSLCDQSSDSSEPSFTIESIMRGDCTSSFRSSTPDMQEEIRKITEMNTFIQPVPEDASVTQQSVPVPPKQSSVSGSKSKQYVRNKDKPPYTYAAMCITAIELSKDKALSVNSIREKLQAMFPFFRGEYKGWKDSVRHCLSSNKAFFKVETTSSNHLSTNLWMVDQQHVKPEMFRKCRSRLNSRDYCDYLHDELGVKPVCSDTNAQDHIKPGLQGIRLPSKPCLGGASSVTTEACESDDFLRASKECIDLNEVRSDMTSSENTVDQGMSMDSFNHKRKCDSVSEQVAKKVKTSRHHKGQQEPRTNATTANPATQYMYPDLMQYPGYTYNYGQFQMPAYYPASTQPTYYPSAPQQDKLYGNNYMAYPMGYYHNNVYSDMTQGYMVPAYMAQGNKAHRSMTQGNKAHGSMTQGNKAHAYMAHRSMIQGSKAHGSMAQGNNTHAYMAQAYMAQGNMAQGYVSPHWSSGMQAALDFMYHRQHNALQPRGNKRWYSLPKNSSEDVLDLTQTPDLTQSLDLTQSPVLTPDLTQSSDVTQSPDTQ